MRVAAISRSRYRICIPPGLGGVGSLREVRTTARTLPKGANPVGLSARAMMRAVRLTIGKLLASTLLTLCIGVQALEATGRWDQTFQDTGDEAVIVTVVLCIGAALVVASATHHCTSLSAVQSPISPARPTPLRWFAPPVARSAFSASPPLSL